MRVKYSFVTNVLQSIYICCFIKKGKKKKEKKKKEYCTFMVLLYINIHFCIVIVASVVGV